MLILEPHPGPPRPACSTLLICPTMLTAYCRHRSGLSRRPEPLPLKTHRWRSWSARQGPLWWRCNWVRSWRQLWWWLSGSAPEGAVDGSTAPWAAVQPDPLHLTAINGFTPCTSKKGLFSTKTDLHQIGFRVFWKHENHLHTSLPTTNGIKGRGGLEKKLFWRWDFNQEREGKKRNASVSATHSHSCEVSTPLCYTSAATGCPFMHDEHEDNDLTVGTLHIPPLRIWNGAAKAWASAAAVKSHRGQAETESASLRGRSQRLPGSSVWPLDHRSWNRKLGKIPLSSRSSPTLWDTTLLPLAYHLKPDCRGQGREAAAPSPLLRRAPERFPNLRPLPDHVTLPRQRRPFRGAQHYQADSGGSRCDLVSLKCPNGSWFPRV